MSDRLKSTVDVAMGRMKQMLGKEEKNLNHDQKRRIAEIRKEYEAKVAEKKILLAGTEELTVELQKLNRDKDERIKAIHQEAEKDT